MAHVGLHALARAVHIPDLDLAVHARAEEQVAVLWKELDRVDSL